MLNFSAPHRSLAFHWRTYLRTAVLFRNGLDMAWHHYWRKDTDAAVFWDGHRLVMPPARAGLVDTVLEIWGVRAYTSHGFYTPRNGDVILDIGANVGAFSLWVAREAPGARIFAFEPASENFTLLQTNLNGWRDRIATYRMAVSGTRGKGHIVDGGKRSIDHRVSLGVDAGESDQVDVITLDEVLALTGAETVDFLKMDIEGAEHDVFANACPPLLRRFRRLSIEYHDNLRPGTLALLRERLAATHDIVNIDGTNEGYGILRAQLRGMNGLH